MFYTFSVVFTSLRSLLSSKPVALLSPLAFRGACYQLNESGMRRARRRWVVRRGEARRSVRATHGRGGRRIPLFPHPKPREENGHSLLRLTFHLYALYLEVAAADRKTKLQPVDILRAKQNERVTNRRTQFSFSDIKDFRVIRKGFRLNMILST